MHVAGEGAMGRSRRGPVVETTLLDLVRAIGAVTEDDREVVATVRALLRSGRVRLSGSFRGQTLDAA